jgi:ABC-type uncharacterized transport system fused permease/ATPase subunit
MTERGATVSGGISLQNATIGWPTGNLTMQTPTFEDQHLQFTLNDLNVTIPPGGLTLVSGPLGSGKTLFASPTFTLPG